MIVYRFLNDVRAMIIVCAAALKGNVARAGKYYEEFFSFGVMPGNFVGVEPIGKKEENHE
jgi:hypothetical protein